MSGLMRLHFLYESQYVTFQKAFATGDALRPHAGRELFQRFVHCPTSLEAGHHFVIAMVSLHGSSSHEVYAPSASWQNSLRANLPSGASKPRTFSVIESAAFSHTSLVT